MQLPGVSDPASAVNTAADTGEAEASVTPEQVPMATVLLLHAI